MIIALKDMTRLLEFVIVQEKKYEEKLLPHYNFYYEQTIVQQFQQIQLKTHLWTICHNLFISIVWLFDKKQGTVHNIIR